VLGNHQNAIVLESGWRAEERAIDPSANVRVYRRPPPDMLTGAITAVTPIGAPSQLSVALDAGTTVPLVQDELAALWITIAEYRFRVRSLRLRAGMNPTKLSKPLQKAMEDLIARGRARIEWGSEDIHP